jgi:DNA-binding winged helix-turn-helix (wHTH) protein
MYYVINDTLIYSPDDGQVYHAEDRADPITTLTPVLNRILLLMISNQGLLITRDEFLEKVWDNYGKQGSAHTLNQYISIIRKLLEQHLNVECIQTVPRQGYLLSQHITINIIESINFKNTDTDTDTDTIADVVSDFSLSSLGIVNNYIRKKIIVEYKKICFVLFVFFTLSIFIYFNYLYFEYGSFKFSQVLHVGGCEIFSKAEDFNKNEKKQSYESVQDIIKTYNLQCNNNGDMYFSKQKSEEDGSILESMLSVCYLDTNGIDNCTSYRVSRR